jgi:nitrogenase molybdenum-iron protein alpha/beta subunit
MRQVAGLISTYSSDEFGICSALYELGGMVVMHDASGCNSTYTTHDEPRWYEMDSMIYISAISEMEAIMGDDDKLIEDLVETATQLQPKFIAVVGAPIPYMIGTDLKAIASVVEKRTKIPSFGFFANGMHTYGSGVSMALEAIVKRFGKKDVEKTETFSVNILGATPLDFSVNGSVDSIKEWLLENEMQVNACLAMGSTLEEISLLGRAHANLVVSYGGLAVAKYLEKEFHMPYVVGVPIGKAFAKKLALELKQEKTKVSVLERMDEAENSLAIIGESVYSASLACAIELEKGISTKVLCPLDTESSLLAKKDVKTPDEDDLMEQLKTVKGVIADPMYRVICPDRVAFYSLPHEAFSGRIYEKENPNLINVQI